MRWIVYDGSVEPCNTEAEWLAAPDVGVQAVVEIDPDAPLRWSCDGEPVRGRRLWTGTDTFDPWGWGEKHGKLISDEAYAEAWRVACRI